MLFDLDGDGEQRRARVCVEERVRRPAHLPSAVLATIEYVSASAMIAASSGAPALVPPNRPLPAAGPPAAVLGFASTYTLGHLTAGLVVRGAAGGVRVGLVR